MAFEEPIQAAIGIISVLQPDELKSKASAAAISIPGPFEALPRSLSWAVRVPRAWARAVVPLRLWHKLRVRPGFAAHYAALSQGSTGLHPWNIAHALQSGRSIQQG